MFYLVIAAINIGLTVGLVLINMRLVRLSRWQRELLAETNEAGMNGGRALHALVMRLSPHGHVDISQEEWEAQEQLELKLIPHDGGIRILAK